MQPPHEVVIHLKDLPEVCKQSLARWQVHARTSRRRCPCCNCLAGTHVATLLRACVFFLTSWSAQNFSSGLPRCAQRTVWTRYFAPRSNLDRRQRLTRFLLCCGVGTLQLGGRLLACDLQRRRLLLGDHFWHLTASCCTCRAPLLGLLDRHPTQQQQKVKVAPERPCANSSPSPSSAGRSSWPSAGAPGIQQPGEQPGTMSSNRSARMAPSRSLRPWLLLAITWACLSASCPSGHALPSGAATLGRARFAAAAAAAAGVRLRAQGAAGARRLLVSVCSSRRLGLWQQSLQITDTHGHVVVCAWRADQGAVRAAQGSVRDGLAGHTYGSDREGGQVSVGLRLARSPV